MEVIGKQEFWSFLDGKNGVTETDCITVRQSKAPKVRSYMELAKKIAELQFLNREHVLLFRGQTSDFRSTQGNTTLRPTIFRSIGKQKRLGETDLTMRFNRLEQAERRLINSYQGNRREHERLKRQRIMRWSILQHYEVCDTPLLDVTHSLRIAASFASIHNPKEAFVFVLGVPNLSGGITASAEAGLQIVRLSSVCPPSAVRPHIQEGYLLGEYPEIPDFNQKQNYGLFEIDFGRRLIAKFRFDPEKFWKDDAFKKIEHIALYPNEHDPLFSQLATRS